MALFKKAPQPTEELVTFLNIGTKILTKDVMDQYIRTLGNHRTHYATNATFAKRAFQEHKVFNVIITEFEYDDGTAFQLIKELRQMKALDNSYVIMAIEKDSEVHTNIAEELDADALIVKPFTALELGNEINIFKEKKQNKTSSYNLLRHATIAFREKKANTAAELFHKAIQLDPENHLVYYKAGQFYLNKPDYEFAEKYLNTALDLRANFIPAIHALGQLALKKNNLTKAFTLLLKAQHASPFNSDRAQLLAKLHLRWAVEELRKMTPLEPKNMELQFELGRIYLLQRDYANALAHLKESRFPEKHKHHKESRVFLDVVGRLGSIK